jgi:hypothetical protein
LPESAFAQGSGATGLLGTTLARVQRRWRLRSMALATAAGGGMFALSLLLSPVLFDASPATALWISLIAGASGGAWITWRSPVFTAVDAARAIEHASGGFDNLIVTAAELDERPRPVSAEIRDEIAKQAGARIGSADPVRAVPLLQPTAVAALVIVGCVLLSRISTHSVVPLVPGGVSDFGSRGAGGFTVRVTPPSYTHRKVEEFADPTQISVIAGSRIHIEGSSRQLIRDWIANESAGLEISPDPLSPARFLSLIVVPDLPPSIRIVAPGKDTAFAEPKGQIAVGIQGGDDLGLQSLSLRFTKAAGGGENVSFTEGEVPLRVERRNEREWIGRAELSLESLGLADGDILVYRAMARDTNPQGVAAQSDQYVIEIGKNASIADAGFALPTEERKYAISQQMVIYKTEQLLSAGNRASAVGSRESGVGRRVPGNEDWLNESRGIGMEQRMVRAEVVFLGGGEVEDELEEAAKSDELTEGRLQNTGRAEMLRAINAMSRAEAQLNEGRAREALVFEREALAHLERALDRRRYFLRTLPDRSRIDATRRLTGERREARSWERDRHGTPAPRSIDAMRAVMRELAAGVSVNASLAARVAAIDPSSTELQQAAVALASASSPAAREEAARMAMAAVTTHALKTLPASAAVDLQVTPLGGRLADELPHLRQGYGGQGPRQ